MEPLKTNEVNNTFETKKETKLNGANPLKPSNAFVGAAWMALLIGMAAFCIGLFNAEMQLNEKGYYFTILLFGLFSVISVQKSVRDRLEGIAVTDIYYGLSWFSTVASVVLLIVGLWNANMLLSEKGFFGMSFALSLFASIAVQKNTRDLKQFTDNNL
ncbi:inner membrane protein YiaA [Flavobacterium subsaxonicum]|uniref:Membrane protein n=1 Tax=Flavobacterium subsaxonicum WB 4.1-42 = DSM 21790 TaxID=1121898 RepID=A0A0A2MWN4_9FLAO|nr:inner membrane protein YiaA [Flavobacterium subsaxonicum]KGO92625.1 membrane protein [Flavobacterium subsaxonicum WB 4.1-42 = DSM 21790]